MTRDSGIQATGITITGILPILETGDTIATRYSEALDTYAAMRKIAALRREDWWEADADLDLAMAVSEVAAINHFTAEGQPKLTEYVLKARVKLAIETDSVANRSRNARHDARAALERADADLSIARERLAFAKAEHAAWFGMPR